MQKLHVRKGDEVVVISGSEKGRRGRVIAVLRKKERVVVEGAMMITRHQRKSAQHPQGRIVEREGTIHWSNVMRAERFNVRKSGTAAGSP